MTLAQRITTQQLARDGFTISNAGDYVLAFKNNDRRIIWADGSVHRATGAKR